MKQQEQQPTNSDQRQQQSQQQQQCAEADNRNDNHQHLNDDDHHTMMHQRDDDDEQRQQEDHERRSSNSHLHPMTTTENSTAAVRTTTKLRYYNATGAELVPDVQAGMRQQQQQQGVLSLCGAEDVDDERQEWSSWNEYNLNSAQKQQHQRKNNDLGMISSTRRPTTTPSSLRRWFVHSNNKLVLVLCLLLTITLPIVNANRGYPLFPIPEQKSSSYYSTLSLDTFNVPAPPPTPPSTPGGGSIRPQQLPQQDQLPEELISGINDYLEGFAAAAADGSSVNVTLNMTLPSNFTLFPRPPQYQPTTEPTEAPSMSMAPTISEGPSSSFVGAGIIDGDDLSTSIPTWMPNESDDFMVLPDAVDELTDAPTGTPISPRDGNVTNAIEETAPPSPVGGNGNNGVVTTNAPSPAPAEEDVASMPPTDIIVNPDQATNPPTDGDGFGIIETGEPTKSPMMDIITVTVPPTTATPTLAPTSPGSTTTPTSTPVIAPTGSPTDTPSTQQPSGGPTAQPNTEAPTGSPVAGPTPEPTPLPTVLPSFMPTTSSPTLSPSNAPSPKPTENPTKRPTSVPTTPGPTPLTPEPTISPKPTEFPTLSPTETPTLRPTKRPTEMPSFVPTAFPTEPPTRSPVLPVQSEIVSVTMLLIDMPGELSREAEFAFQDRTEQHIRRAIENLNLSADDDSFSDLNVNGKIREQTPQPGVTSLPSSQRQRRRRLLLSGGGDGGDDDSSSRRSDRRMIIRVGQRRLEDGAEPLRVIEDVQIMFRSARQDYNVASWVREAFNSEEDQENFIQSLRDIDNTSFDNLRSIDVLVDGDDPLGGGNPAGGDEPLNSTGMWIIIASAGGGFIALGILGILALRRVSSTSADSTPGGGNAGASPVVTGKETPVSTTTGPNGLQTEIVVERQDDISTLGDPVFGGGVTGGMMMMNAVGERDERTASVTDDYEYAKQYLLTQGVRSMDDNNSRNNFTSSENSGPTRESSNESAGFSKQGPMGTSVFTDDASFEQQYADSEPIEQRFEVEVPAGKLGMVIDTPNGGIPVVHAIKPESVLSSHVRVGDRLIQVDDEDVTELTAVQVSKLISLKSDKTRLLTFVRSRGRNDSVDLA